MASNSDGLLKEILSTFEKHTKKPEKFLSVQNEPASQFVNITKELYDFTWESGVSSDQNALPELIVQDFDDEQIWQEIELQNDPSVKDMLSKVSRLAAADTLDFDLVPREVEESEEESTGGIEHKGIEEEDGDDSVDEESLSESSEQPVGIIPEAMDGSSDEEDNRLKEALDKITGDVGGESGSDPSDEEDADSDVDFDFDLDSKAKDKSTSKSDKSAAKKTEQGTGLTKQMPKRKTIVDDKFFKMADMEVFLDQEDAKEERKIRREKGEEVESSDDESEDMDMFVADDEDEDEDNDDDDDEEGPEIKYEDFFDPPDDDALEKKKETSQKKAKKEESDEEVDDKEDVDESDDDDEDEEQGDDSGEDDDDDSEEEEVKGAKAKDLFDDDESEGEDAEEILGQKKKASESQFEQRQSRMKKKITEIEETMLEQKPWQLSGEASAKSRPENSLLQEDLDFEHTTKVAPVVTEETTLKLEDFIKQRVRDKAWDDVERKVKPTEEPYQYKKRVVLDQEKSKLSLGEVYEQEYIKQTATEEEEKADPAQEVIKKMMTSLFVKLDALTNFHFTPKPSAPDIKIVSNLPSVAMEEVAPTSVSDAALLAPEEVRDKEKGALKGDTEKDKTDKKRALREKKKKQRVKQQVKEKKEKLLEKVNPGLGNKYAKEKAMKDLEKQSKQSKRVTVIKDDNTKSGLTSSTKFFSQLQDEVTAQIQSKKAHKSKKKEGKTVSSAKLKL